MIEGYIEVTSLMGVRSGYTWELNDCPESTTLIVCLATGPSLQRWVPKGSWSLLFLADLRSSYFMWRIQDLAKAITWLARKRGFGQIVVIGGSKAGFGAALLGGMLSRNTTGDILCMCFCPQTQVWPYNENIRHISSYQDFVKRLQYDKTMALAARRYGDVARWCRRRNCRITLIYNAGNAVDVKEAARLSGSNVRAMPLPFSFHNATLPFLARGLPAHRTTRFVEVIYSTAENDIDLMQALPNDPEELKRAIRETPWIPTVTQLIDIALREGWGRPLAVPTA